MEKTYLTKKAVALTGLSVDTIRFYEQKGLIGKVARDKNGYRQYSKQDIEWLKIIGYLRTLGVSIPAMQQFISEHGNVESSYQQRLIFMENYQQIVEERIAKLTDIQQQLVIKVQLLKRMGNKL